MRQTKHEPATAAEHAVTVLTVDDEPAFRAAARAVVHATPGFRPVAEAASGAEAIALAERLRPDLVLMDVRMPGLDGVEAAHAIARVSPRSAVVFVSADGAHAVPLAARPKTALAVLAKEELRPARLRRLWSWRA
ncbi:MAG TPA: response regulator [Solirubrobacteraceae bacterium]|nr:response regulator [Solirubrobacteraceae bacterium]